jgi:hypothetical protein
LSAELLKQTLESDDVTPSSKLNPIVEAFVSNPYLIQMNELKSAGHDIPITHSCMPAGNGVAYQGA